MVSLNTNYSVTLTYDGSKIYFKLTNLDLSTSKTDTIDVGINAAGVGPVSIGGWMVERLNENFIGTISYVSVDI